MDKIRTTQNPYSAADYLRNGLTVFNNLCRPRHKRLTSLMLYATTRCQSRCQHCNIWQKPEEHLSLGDIARIVQSRCVTPRTVIGLEGGEFVLHPEARAILAWFRRHHPNYTLLSNCLAPDLVIAAAKEFRPKRLYVSLDGPRETYQRMRGRDGYAKVIRTVEACRRYVPVSLMFCLSPFNGFGDMQHVIGVAREMGVDVRIGIYGQLSYFDTKAAPIAADEGRYLEQIPADIHETRENYDFTALYNEWRNGHLRLRCHSIFNELAIHANGDVPLCQNLNLVLGNIRESSLDDIFNGAAACRLQHCRSRQCNDCWINYHRKFDIILLRTLEKAFPKRLIEKIYGPYQWAEDASQTYRDYFRNISSSNPYARP